MDAITTPPAPVNEPNLAYAPGNPEREQLTAALVELASTTHSLDARIGDDWVTGTGPDIPVVQPHAHQSVLGVLRNSSTDDTVAAIAAAREAAPAWRSLSYDDRAAVFLRAAELLAGPWRQRLNAATVLGQSKTAFQAEIDAACELIDFWRFNVHFGREILTEQPIRNAPGVWNRTDHRPLEGFVYAITPFNFTAIAGNLPTAPALMGNTVIWKPSPTQQLAATLTMELLIEAGLPPGVINMLPGDGLAVSEVALADPHLAGIHFTGSTPTFQRLWATVGAHLPTYRTYPRLVGETGGKDFVIAHPSADPDVLRTALIRGAFEYAGQKCSAASRAYVPRSLWERMGDDLVAATEGLSIGDPTDFSHFTGAVIDARALAKHRAAIERAHATDGLTVVAGGSVDDSVGWFVRPTIVLADDPGDEMFSTEYFGPILALHVYDDSRPGAFDEIVRVAESAAPYALTGAVLATDRAAIARASETLRFAAGNFYVNDKPTGAVVGQQPFGGGRASGTNDKAGSALNLLRWTSPRSIKETLVPSTDHRYPHMG
ncbi:L-glutamate gamma-semialdehyde dehydrogenase [Nocardioides caeni]|uniref:L-glutamate gamma-semialdehyde dehydrogenase n=1 Tax=Nocardioides caeni TaxID=574700 RepID=A0A4S8NMZ6_9ACTN|nr:L-glutamate gamma-semialdehyde dehydrogenase [Nocardioides caeni]THV18320.1 L-glutamate gamma-semialdehyde dehydrogenase [Nocardioides caeni]